MVTREQIDYATDVYTAKRQVYDTSGRLVEHKRLWADGSALFPSLKNPKTFMWFTKLRNGGKLTTEQVIQFLGRHGLQSIYQDAQAYEKKGRDAEDLLDELRQIGSIMDTLYKMGGELTPEELRITPDTELDKKLLQCVRDTRESVFLRGTGVVTKEKVAKSLPRIENFRKVHAQKELRIKESEVQFKQASQVAKLKKIQIEQEETIKKVNAEQERLRQQKEMYPGLIDLDEGAIELHTCE